jgi:hypothetical protein
VSDSFSKRVWWDAEGLFRAEFSQKEKEKEKELSAVRQEEDSVAVHVRATVITHCGVHCMQNSLTGKAEADILSPPRHQAASGSKVDKIHINNRGVCNSPTCFYSTPPILIR